MRRYVHETQEPGNREASAARFDDESVPYVDRERDGVECRGVVAGGAVRSAALVTPNLARTLTATAS